MVFQIVPSVHLVDRAFPDLDASEVPTKAATRIARQYGALYVVDVEGVRRNKPDIEFLRDLSRNRPIWLDPGARGADDVMDAMVAGGERVVLRWPTFDSADALAELAEMANPDTLFVMLEHDENAFLANPLERHLDAPAVAALAREHGLDVLVAAPAFDEGVARRLGGDGGAWWYGPVSREEAKALRRLGYAGAVVPEALAADAAEGAKDEEVQPE